MSLFKSIEINGNNHFIWILIVFIGQRDKPFVRDDEYDVRTPRPDLLNRPYAPNYSGDYRDQFNVKSLILIK